MQNRGVQLLSMVLSGMERQVWPSSSGISLGSYIRMTFLAALPGRATKATAVWKKTYSS